MAIYMEYEGVKGNSTTDGFKDMIVLDSCSFGASRNITIPHRALTSREASEPALSEITVSMSMASHSAKMFNESVASDLKNKVLIHFTTTTANKVTEYLLVTLTNVGLSHYSLSAGHDGIPVESAVLNYDTIQTKFTPMDPGVSGSPETVGYDLTQMKTM
jgi:type VI secretion system secreted protein Hcp